MGPPVRIIARIIAGWFMSKGYYSLESMEQIFNDPASDAVFDLIAGGIVWAVTELFYIAARRLGWTT